MATWTNIPDSVLEPGKPARSVDALALRDNAIAIAEGAPGAPRISGQQGPAVNTGGIANSAVTNPKIANGAVNNVKIANVDASKITTGTIPGLRMPMAAGGVGTYALVTRRGTGNSVEWGGAIAGSGLTYASAKISTDSGMPGVPYGSVALSGTWRIMGYRTGTTSNSGLEAVLAVRIS